MLHCLYALFHGVLSLQLHHNGSQIARLIGKPICKKNETKMQQDKQQWEQSPSSSHTDTNHVDQHAQHIQSLVDDFITALNLKAQSNSNEQTSSAQITSNLQQLVDRIYTEATPMQLSSDDTILEELLAANTLTNEKTTAPAPLVNTLFQTSKTTKPESFQFQLDKRKTESKQDDLSVRIHNEEMANVMLILL